MTGLIGKVKDALSSNSHHEQPEGTHGHHSSRAANAADPRIDSDRDHRANPAGAHDGTYSSTDNYTYGAGNNRGVDGPATRTDGPHSSNVANKVDPRVDSDRDHSRNLGANPSGTATTGAHNTTGTSGLHSSTGAHTGTTGLSSGTHTGTTGTHTSTAGPHNSNLLNKADPRVDSDRDGSRNLGANPSGTATTGTYGTTGTHGTHGTTGLSSGTTGTHSSTAGPHNSNLLNKADPRVDSDRDGSRNLGANPSGTTTTGTYGSTGATGTHGTHAGTTGLSSTGTTGGNRTAGPHNSDLLNKADPRVDSDRDGSRNLGLNSSSTAGAHTGTTGTHGTTGLSGTTGTHGTHGTTGLGSSSGAPEGTYGPHGSRVANAADPRVDSDRDNRGTTGTAGGKSAVGGFGTTGTHTGAHTGAHTGTTGTSGLTGASGTHATGPAPNTAGPHKSDLLNKADPRVDSDLDGSKTNPVNTHKDPTDAAQVPPSVLQKHIGPPVVEHDDHHHNRADRHSISHQEDHRGL